MNITTNWHLSPNVEDILRGQGMQPEVVQTSKPMLTLVAEQARVEGLNLLHPVVVTSEVMVREHRHDQILLTDGLRLTGSLVARQLAGAQRVVAVACTIGSKLEEIVTHLLSEEPLYALALDGLANAAVEILAQKVCSRIGEQVRSEGLQASMPLSPGNSEWPVEIGQPQIFALVDPSQAGIILTSGGMMFPKKSMSFIVGLGMKMSQAGMCEVCSLKGTCRYSHA